MKLIKKYTLRLFLHDPARNFWLGPEESAFPSVLPGQEVPRP